MLADGKPPATPGTSDTVHALTRVMALHAVAYCERLFYLEEVEEIRIADERVYAGRILHESLPDDQPLTNYVLESERLGIRGKFDAVKRQDGQWIEVEHKRGRSNKRADGIHDAWDSDRVHHQRILPLLVRPRDVSAGRIWTKRSRSETSDGDP